MEDADAFSSSLMDDSDDSVNISDKYDLETALKRIANLSDLNKGLNENILELQRQLNEAIAQASGFKEDALRYKACKEQMKSMILQNEELKNQIANGDLYEENQRLLRERYATDGQLLRYQDMIKEAKKGLVEAVETTENQQQHMELLAKKLQKKEKKIKKLKLDNEDKEKQIIRLNAKNSSLESTVDALTSANSELETKISKMELKSNECVAYPDENMIKSLYHMEELLETQKDEVKSLTSSKTRLEELLQKSQSVCIQLECVVSDLTNENTKLKRSMSNQKAIATVEPLQITIPEYSGSSRDECLRICHSDLYRPNQKVSLILSEMGNEITEVRTHNKQLESKITDLESRREALQTELLEKQNSSAAETNEALFIASLVEANKALTKQLESHQIAEPSAMHVKDDTDKLMNMNIKLKARLAEALKRARNAEEKIRSFVLEQENLRNSESLNKIKEMIQFNQQNINSIHSSTQSASNTSNDLLINEDEVRVSAGDSAYTEQLKKENASLKREIESLCQAYEDQLARLRLKIKNTTEQKEALEKESEKKLKQLSEQSAYLLKKQKKEKSALKSTLAKKEEEIANLNDRIKKSEQELREKLRATVQELTHVALSSENKYNDVLREKNEIIARERAKDQELSQLKCLLSAEKSRLKSQLLAQAMSYEENINDKMSKLKSECMAEIESIYAAISQKISEAYSEEVFIEDSEHLIGYLDRFVLDLHRLKVFEDNVLADQLVRKKIKH